MNDITSKYLDMICSFECDFSLASDKCSDFSLYELQEQINHNLNLKLNNDIELLNELSFGLRHGFIKIYDIRTNFT